MITLKGFKENLSQILALTEKNIKLRLRYKLGLVLSYITHIISIITPMILMGNIFQLRNEVGSWTSNNFIVYQFIAYNIMLLSGVSNLFPGQFKNEKYWKTLPALIIGPFNRFNLLFGIFLSHLIMIAFPFTLFFILGCVFQPISLITIISVLAVFFLIAIIFSGLGLILGVFAISNENIWNILQFLLLFVFWFSCITYPFEIFPQIVQDFVFFNPFFHLFLFLRLLWIEDNVILTLSLYPYQFLFIVGFAIIGPIIGVIIFNKIYERHGIVGY